MNVEIRLKFWQNPGFYLALVFLAFVVVVIVLSWDFNYRARAFPMIVGFSSLPLILIDVLAKIFPAFNRKVEALRGGGFFEAGKTTSGDSTMKSPENTQSEKVNLTLLSLFFWFGGCFIFFYLFGYLIAMVAFLFFFLKFFCSCRLLGAIEITAGVVVPTYVIFTFLLKIPAFW